VSEVDAPDIYVRSELRAGVYADHVDVCGDFEELTIDFARLDRGVRPGEISSPAWPFRAGAY
jgi:hypothetical protein